MHNDSIETLLLRHYGHTAPSPTHLEQRLLSSTRREAATRTRSQSACSRFFARPISRRKAVRFVAIGSAGVGVLSTGLQAVEIALLGQDMSQAVYP